MLIDGDYLYRLSANEFYSDVMLTKGSKFTVYGDTGSSDGYAYGCTEEGRWGFVPISEISTKGTISQYNNFLWEFPVYNNKYKKISSVYGWRGNDRHLGFDINKGDYSSILGEPVVAISNGKVVFTNKVYDEVNKTPNYGYCVVIESENIDPVSGNKLRAVYMHLQNAPELNIGNSVKKGELVGVIGSTGNSN